MVCRVNGLAYCLSRISTWQGASPYGVPLGRPVGLLTAAGNSSLSACTDARPPGIAEAHRSRSSARIFSPTHPPGFLWDRERIGAGGKQHGNNGAVLASAWGMGRGRHLPKERENKNRVCFLKLKNSGFCLFLLKPLRENRRGCGKAAGTAGRGQWAGTQGLAKSDQYRHNRDFMQNLQRKLTWGI